MICAQEHDLYVYFYAHIMYLCVIFFFFFSTLGAYTGAYTAPILTLGEGVSSNMCVCRPVCMCLSRSSLVSRGQRGRPTERQEQQSAGCTANSYRVCFLRAVFMPTAHAVFSHLSKPIQAPRNISHLHALVTSLAPRGATHTLPLV